MPTEDPAAQGRAALENLLGPGSTLPGSSIAPAAPGGFDPTGGMGTIVGKVSRNATDYSDERLWSGDINAYWGIEVMDEPIQGAGDDIAQMRHVGEYPEHVSTKLPQGRPVSHIIQTLLNMSSRERIILQERLKKGGYLNDFKPGAADDATVGALGDVLMETARQGLSSGESVSWQDYLTQRITDVESDEAKAAQSRTFTQTNTSVTTKESGRGVIWDAFRDAVGRDPSESEIDKFMARLNSAERANPTTTTTTVGTDGSSSSTTSGGMDAAAQSDMVRQEVQGNDQYAEYQAAAYYMPLMFQALDASTDLEGGL